MDQAETALAPYLVWWQGFNAKTVNCPKSVDFLTSILHGVTRTKTI